jgi:uncharacterized membrane protein
MSEIGTGVGGAAARRRRTVATYNSYSEAERAVDYLSDNKFPVEHVSIVGRDLRLVEHITGRMNWGRAALNGALTGAMVGLLIGWLFAIFGWFDPSIARFWLIVDGIWFGALIGATMGLLTYLFLRGRRDFSSVGAMQAAHYDIVIDEEFADQAMQVLGQMGQSIQPSGEPASQTTATTQGPG